MTKIGFSLVVTWGFWILAVALLVTVGFLWCHGVNQKLRYILGRLEQLGGGKGGQPEAGVVPLPKAQRAQAPRPASKGNVPSVVAVIIIGAAIFFLFIVPVWMINR